MRAFVTGIAGFVGTHLTEHLHASGDQVLGTSLSGTWGDDAATKRLPPSLHGVSLLPWDIALPAPAAMQTALQEFAPQAIYHLAAVSKAIDGATEYAQQTNIGGTQHVLELAKALPSQPRVLFVSSSYVYGDASSVQPVSESSPLPGQLDGYGHSKREGERETLEHVAEGGDAVIARAFQHAGPRQSARFMLAEWCDRFLREQGTDIAIGSSETWLDLSDVRDVVRAYRLLMTQGVRGEIYNVGSGVARRTGDIFAQLCRVAGSPRVARPRSTQQRYTPIADLTKITTATGWQPQISIEQTIADTYAWFRDSVT